MSVPPAEREPANRSPTGPSRSLGVTPAGSSGPVPAALREPVHQVSPRAVGFWRLSALITAAVPSGCLLVAVASTYAIAGWDAGRPWLMAAGTVLFALLAARVIWMPPLRFRIHRWEVTDTAIHTRSGWLARAERIAPLSRVQTVDSRQGAVMRLFKLATITVTTASAAGPIEIACLDQEVARRVVADLTEQVGQSVGDAT
ncbi:MAG: PH domain-containing protein [Nocardioides sp.]